jgi:hypothetical protein
VLQVYYNEMKRCMIIRYKFRTDISKTDQARYYIEKAYKVENRIAATRPDITLKKYYEV